MRKLRLGEVKYPVYIYYLKLRHLKPQRKFFSFCAAVSAGHRSIRQACKKAEEEWKRILFWSLSFEENMGFVSLDSRVGSCEFQLTNQSALPEQL